MIGNIDKYEPNLFVPSETAVTGLIRKEDYGTNNRNAWLDLCTLGGYHQWEFNKSLGKCYNEYKCKCGAIHKIDSSD